MTREPRKIGGLLFTSILLSRIKIVFSFQIFFYCIRILSRLQIEIQMVKVYNVCMKTPYFRDRIALRGRPCTCFLVSFLTAFALFFVQPANAQTAADSTLRLIGTIGGPLFSGAVLQDSTGKQVFYRLYEKLPNGSKIVHLEADSISLKGEDGAVYDIFIAHDTKTAASGSGTSSASYDPAYPSQQHTFTPAQQESLTRKKQRAINRAQGRRSDLDE
jgi:hypothetical protein